MKKRKTQKFPVLFLVIGGLLLIVAATLLWTQNKSNQAIPTSPVSSQHDEETYPEIARVSLAEAKSALDAGSAVFLDVRDADSYASNHISGALNIPFGELETLQTELNPNQWIITYCTWPSEESSARAARTLLDNGFKNVNPLLGGFEAWSNAGYPVEP